MSAPVTERPPAGPQPSEQREPGVLTRILREIIRVCREHTIAVLVGLLLLWLVGAPLFFLLRMSLGLGSPADPGPVTILNYQSVFADAQTLPAIRNTAIYSVGVSAVSLFVAVTAAWLIERTDMPGRNLAWVAMLAPLAVPGLLASMAWILLLAPQVGAVNVFTRWVLGLVGLDLEGSGPFNIYSMPGMIFVEGMRGTTTLFLMVVGAFRLMDPAMEDAAAMSGAGRLQTLRRVTLPLMAPALLAATVYAFLGNLQDFDTPLLLGLPAGIFILPTLIYFVAYVSPIPNWGMAAAYASLFLVVLGVLTVWYYKVVIKRSRRFATISGKAYRPQRIRLRRWRWPAAGLFVAFFLVSVGLPLLILFWSSLLPGYRPPSLAALEVATFDNYVRLWNDGRTWVALWNSAKLAVGTATIGMGVAFLVSWAVVRVRVRGGMLMDAMAFVPNAIPTVSIGLGLIILYLNPIASWTRVYGTVFILVIGLVVNYLAFSTRLSNGAMAQLSAELEEQSWVAGRGKLFTLVRITTPLLLPTFLAGWVWVAAHAVRNLTIPLLLGTRGNEVLSQRLYELWSLHGDLPYSSTIGVMFLVILVGLAFGARRMITRGFTTE